MVLLFTQYESCTVQVHVEYCQAARLGCLLFRFFRQFRGMIETTVALEYSEGD